MTQQPSDRPRGGIGQAAEARLLERFGQIKSPGLEVVNDDFAAMNVPWQIHKVAAQGATAQSKTYARAERRAPIKSELLDKIDFDSYNTNRRRLAPGKNVVTMLCQLPLLREDIEVVLDVERSVEAQSAGPERVRDSLKGRLTAHQQEVIRHIARPLEEVGEKVGISEKAARAAVDAARGRSRLGTRRRFMSQAILEEMVDVSELSPVSTADGPLSPSQKEYIINDCLVGSEKSSGFTKEILRVLGAKTMYEVFAMAVRDGLVSIQPLIPNTAPPAK